MEWLSIMVYLEKGRSIMVYTSKVHVGPYAEN
jgi:hypothetical protein